MKHITEYDSRKVATTSYANYRKIWDRQASILLVHYRHAVTPAKRLAAAVTLMVYRIPLTGDYNAIGVATKQERQQINKAYSNLVNGE